MNKYDTIVLFVQKNDIVAVYEKNDKNRHKMGTIPFSETDRGNFNKMLTDLFIDFSMSAQGKTEDEILFLAKTMKYVWEFEQ